MEARNLAIMLTDKDTGAPAMPGMTIENVRFSKQGIDITGAKGEPFQIGKDGAAVKDRNGKVWKSKVDVGVGSDKSKVPVSMSIWGLYMGLTCPR